jgi:hypothetical protein
MIGGPLARVQPSGLFYKEKASLVAINHLSCHRFSQMQHRFQIIGI